MCIRMETLYGYGWGQHAGPHAQLLLAGCVLRLGVPSPACCLLAACQVLIAEVQQLVADKERLRGDIEAQQQQLREEREQTEGQLSALRRDWEQRQRQDAQQLQRQREEAQVGRWGRAGCSLPSASRQSFVLPTRGSCMLCGKAAVACPGC